MTATYIRPMLGQPFLPRHFVPGMTLQPKLDGVRLMVHDGETLMTRDGITFHSGRLLHLRQSLQKHDLRGITLDGELYIHGMSLQEINSRVRVKSTTPHPLEFQLEYHVFDVVSESPFDERFLTTVPYIFKSDPAIKVVPTYFVLSLEDAQKLHHSHLDLRYEGSMLRRPDEGYLLKALEKENRDGRLLKWKPHEDCVATIRDLVRGDNGGRFRDTLGSMYCELPDGTAFYVGKGFTDEQRQRYWEDPSLVVGQQIRVKYSTTTLGGLPRDSRAVCVYERID